MYLENSVFNARYIEPNISWYVSYFRGNKLDFKKIFP